MMMITKCDQFWREVSDVIVQKHWGAPGGGRPVINITCEDSHADHDDDDDDGDGDANYDDDHDFNLDNITIVLSQF